MYQEHQKTLTKCWFGSKQASSSYRWWRQKLELHIGRNDFHNFPNKFTDINSSWVESKKKNR